MPGLFGDFACKGKRILEVVGDRFFGLDHSFEQAELDLVFDIADGERTDAEALPFRSVAIGIDRRPSIPAAGPR